MPCYGVYFMFSFLHVNCTLGLSVETRNTERAKTKGTDKTFHLAPLNYSQYKSLRMKNMMTYISVIYF